MTDLRRRLPAVRSLPAVRGLSAVRTLPTRTGLPPLPTKDELREFAAELRRESRPRIPLELDPRSPLYEPAELRSGMIAVGLVAVTLFAGLTIGLVALFA